VSIVEAIEKMLADGLTIQQALIAARAIEAQNDVKSARQKRNARYYEANRERLKASELRRAELRRIQTPSVLIKTPLARVDDSSTTTELSGKKVKNISHERLNQTPRSLLLECLSAESADAVLAHRRAMRRPLTTRAAQLLAKGFMSTGDPNAAADMMIERGWQGFKPEWFDNERAGNGNGKGHSRGSIVDAGRKLTERLLAAEREQLQAVNSIDHGDPAVRLFQPFGRQRS
jgi:hypothetical protein